MTLQQLEYIVAVDTHRHFATAAEACFVTQPTLSMMIQKLEDELDVRIFDRSRQPVVPTEAGKAIVEQARVVLMESNKLRAMVLDLKGSVRGKLRIGVIPTVAPCLIPLFLSSFIKKYPDVELTIDEMTTADIETALARQELDAGLLTTPISNTDLKVVPIYYEKFFLYANRQLINRLDAITLSDLAQLDLWLLNEGHCLRTQVLNFCGLRHNTSTNLAYETGSVETLKRLVQSSGGATILPELACTGWDVPPDTAIVPFQSPSPGREISLVTYRHYAKQKLTDALRHEIAANIPMEMREPSRIVPIMAG